MKRRISKKGRVIIEMDGYSEGYKALVVGAPTGAVSFPSKHGDRDDSQLSEMAKDCLYDAVYGTDNTGYYGAKIIKRLGKVV